jgi:hypothetical protein
MRDKLSDDKIIQELQKKLNELNNDELDNTYWEIGNIKISSLVIFSFKSLIRLAYCNI